MYNESSPAGLGVASSRSKFRCAWIGCRKSKKLKGLARGTMMALSSSRKLFGWLGVGG